MEFLYDDKKNYPHFTVSHKDLSICHEIYWERLGTFCDLPMNEQYIYHNSYPEGCILCEKCAKKKGMFVDAYLIEIQEASICC
jgi:hypothetical protein